MRDDGFFDGIEQAPVNTSAGPCELPILYRDGSVIGLVYRVEPERAASCMPPCVPFEPFLVLGKALVQLVAFEYRDTTIGPYAELALTVQVKVRGSAPSLLLSLLDQKGVEEQGSFFLNLPVTTAGACAAGREIWGYPKYVVPIDTDFRKEGVRVEQRGELELRVGPAGRFRSAGMPFLLMSVNNGRILRTTVETGHKLSWGGAASVELRVLGAGPTADNISRLGLEADKPTAVWRAPRMRSILPLGKDLGPA
jgi:hypothetical protein